jgi:CubicO group peptidase (beta-lactamase class C family)
MLPLFADLPPIFPPGDRFRYADANYILIGLVIEATTGRRFHDVVHDQVLQPAGMTDTSFTALDLDPERLAVGYFTSDRPTEKGRTNIYSVPAVGMPDGGIITSAEDLARFFDALVGGCSCPRRCSAR